MPKPRNSRIYYSRNKGHRIACPDKQEEIHYTDGRLAKAEHTIIFTNHFYETGDRIEQDTIEKTMDFRLGRIKQVDTEQRQTILGAQAKAMGKGKDRQKPAEDTGYEETPTDAGDEVLEDATTGGGLRPANE